MAALNDDVKAFIVNALACYDTPSQVAASVKEEFGVDVSRMQVSVYDPTKKMGKALSAKWRELFESTRGRFLEAQAAVPIANSNFRLRALHRMYAQAEQRGNVVFAAQLLEQAAKETGGVFTNRQKHDHSGEIGVTVNIVRFGKERKDGDG